MKRNRLKTLLTHDINLYGYHLPLDAHPELGNNAQLAKLLEIQVLGEIESLLPYGEFTTPLNAVALRERLEKQLGRSVLHCGDRRPQRYAVLPGVRAAGRGISNKRLSSVSMHL